MLMILIPATCLLSPSVHIYMATQRIPYDWLTEEKKTLIWFINDSA